MLTEGRVRAIAAQVASAIARKLNPNISEEQIAEVQKNAEAAIAAKTAAEEAAARAEEARKKRQRFPRRGAFRAGLLRRCRQERKR